ncbi:MAG: hypothetical protein U0R78_05455 [Nocardioidaceae bacterium]
MVRTRFDAADLGVTESLFSVANGYLGLRSSEESRDAYVDGTFVNGETWPILHAGEAHGLARVEQSIVNAPDPKVIRLYVDDEPLGLSSADLLDYERALDFRAPASSPGLAYAERQARAGQQPPDGVAVEAPGRDDPSRSPLLDGRGPVQLSSQLLNRQDRELEHPVEAPPPPSPTRARPRSSGDACSVAGRPDRGEVGPHPAGLSALSGMTLGVVVDHTVDAPVDVRSSSPHLRGRGQDDLSPPAGEPARPSPSPESSRCTRPPRSPPRADRPCRADPRPRCRGGARRAVRRTAGLARRLLGTRDVQLPGQRAPAGRAMEPVPDRLRPPGARRTGIRPRV